MFDLLESVRATLAAVPNVKTAKIGLEPNIVPADYPIVRIVPARILPGANPIERIADVWVYFGAPVLESSDGLATVYSALFDMESDIRAALKKLSTSGFAAKFVETVTDEDRLEHYKLFASRFEIKVLGQ